MNNINQEEKEALGLQKKFRTDTKRKCHDCGKPTYNYRCDKCWDALRQKNGCSPSSVELDPTLGYNHALYR